MIRKNGTYTFYVVQHLQKDGKWVNSNFDFFCSSPNFKVGTEPYRIFIAIGEPYRSFTAIGECWKEIGEYGCYNLSTGLSFLKQISQAWPNYKFQLVKVKIKQETTIIEVRHGKS